MKTSDFPLDLDNFHTIDDQIFINYLELLNTFHTGLKILQSKKRIYNICLVPNEVVNLEIILLSIVGCKYSAHYEPKSRIPLNNNTRHIVLAGFDMYRKSFYFPSPEKEQTRAAFKDISEEISKSTIVLTGSDIKYSESETADMGLSLSRLTHNYTYLSNHMPDIVQMLTDKIHLTAMQHIVQWLAKQVAQNIKDDDWN